MKTFPEIGRELGLPDSTVYSIYFRAIDKLRKNTPNAVQLLKLYAEDLQRQREESPRPRP